MSGGKKVTPIRKPPDAGNFLDEAATLAGYEGQTSAWARAVVQAEAQRLFAKEEQPAAEKDWEAIAKSFAARPKHMRSYLIVQFIPTLAAGARTAVPKEQLIEDAEAMVDDVESGRFMQRAHGEQQKVKTFTAAQAKAELRKRGP